MIFRVDLSDDIFSNAVGPFLQYLSRQRYSSKYPQSNSAELPLNLLPSAFNAVNAYMANGVREVGTVVA